MNVEIERKYTVKMSSWKKEIEGDLFRQGYLSTNKHRTVRVRQTGSSSWITVKGLTQGISRLEFEYEIPTDDAGLMLDQLCEKPIIEKTRYKIIHQGYTWEVDEFHGVNEGLVIAEIELSSEDEEFAIPDWIGEEVTGDIKYYNSSLTNHPFSKW